MANESVTLYLDGTPTIGEFATAMAGMRDLIAAIEKQVAPNAAIEWRIDSLVASSALASVRGESADMSAVGLVADTYVGVSKDARRGRQLDSAYVAPMASITGLLGERIPNVRFENDQEDETFTAGENLAEIIQLWPAQDTPELGAVEGKIETVSSHNGLRFVLYDLNFRKAVTCYLAPGSEDLMIDMWGKLAIVEGVVKRDAGTGRPLVIRQVSDVTQVKEGNLGDWRRSIGVLPKSSLSSEERVRRMRDAQ